MKPLTSTLHFHTAAIERKAIVVYLDGERITSGKIEEITERAVRIGDEFFFLSLYDSYQET